MTQEQSHLAVAFLLHLLHFVHLTFVLLGLLLAPSCRPPFCLGAFYRWPSCRWRLFRRPSCLAQTRERPPVRRVFPGWRNIWSFVFALLFLLLTKKLSPTF